jgi:DNA methylase
MGKDWDKALPPVEAWKECLRVLKPGAFGFIMCSPRQDLLSRMIVSLEDAGFNTNYTSMYWTYSSGFPKAMSVGKKVDKDNGVKRELIGRNPNSRENCTIENTIYESGTVGKTDFITKGSSPLEGSYGGFQPKPAVEVILVVMKPMTEKTFTAQALDNNHGITWLDSVRIPYADDSNNPATNPLYRAQNGYKIPEKGVLSEGAVPFTSSLNEVDERGRFAGNLIVSDKVLDMPSAGRRTKTFGNEGEPVSGGEKEVDWEANQTGRFPAALLVSDEVLDTDKTYKQATRTYKDSTGQTSWFLNGQNGDKVVQGSSQKYSRYFSLDSWWKKVFPFFIVSKASKNEKELGLNNEPEMIKGRDEGQDIRNVPQKTRPTGRKNLHTTVKPVKLMAYLITLGSREGEVVLDPFAGSFTTGIAATGLKRKFIGIEKNEEYFKLGRDRMK